MTSKIIIVFVASSFFVAIARGNDEMKRWLNPDMGEIEHKTGAGSESFVQKGINKQFSTFQFTEYKFETVNPLLQNDKREWWFRGEVKTLDIETRARFPDTGQKFPDELSDIYLSTGYRHKLANGWIAGGSLGIGSAGDQPFKTAGQTTLYAGGVLRIPSGKYNAWLLYATLSSELDGRGLTPVGGIGYLLALHRKLQVVIGAPRFWARYTPVKAACIEVDYTAPHEIHAVATYAINESVQLYSRYDNSSQRYILHNRIDKKDRLFHYHQRVKGGLTWNITKHISLDVGGGYAFRRFFFKGEGYNDRHDNRISISNGPFAGAQLVMKF